MSMDENGSAHIMAQGMRQKVQSFFRCKTTNGTTSDTVSNSASKRVRFQGSDENFLRNGRVLQEESVSLFYGRTNPIRCLSVDDLNNSFQNWILCQRHGLWDWYKSVWEERPVIVKIFHKYSTDSEYQLQQRCREIVTATQMGIHKKVHKLLACCLESECPVLVYEFIQHDSLLDRILWDQNQNRLTLEWKDKLTIAWEISHTVAYLHTAFPRPIIHRNLTLSNVFLDQHNAAKLADFSLSVLIPEGKTFLELERIEGTYGYIAPEYTMFGKVMQKLDVYSFGVLFLELLTGKRCPDRATLLSSSPHPIVSSSCN